MSNVEGGRHGCSHSPMGIRAPPPGTLFRGSSPPLGAAHLCLEGSANCYLSGPVALALTLGPEDSSLFPSQKQTSSPLLPRGCVPLASVVPVSEGQKIWV